MQLTKSCCDIEFTLSHVNPPLMSQQQALSTNDAKLYGGNAKRFSHADCSVCGKHYVLWLKPEKNTYRVLTASLREDIEQPGEVKTPFDDMDKAQLRQWLDEHHIEYIPQWSESRLRELSIQSALQVAP